MITGRAQSLVARGLVIAMLAASAGTEASASRSVAAAPNGDIAYVVTANRYDVHRLSASGRVLARISPPRPYRRTECRWWCCGP